ncbi:MAG: LCP family protein [Actinomycetota bacterium]|nr:LCP family protein [Actinomycetota bacterium]
MPESSPTSHADDQAAEGPYSTGTQPAEPGGRSRRHSPWRRVVIIVLVSGLVLGLGAFGVLWFLTDRYLGNVERISDPFSGLEESERPAPATPAEKAGEAPLTFILVGSDSRDPAAEGPPTARSDVIMLMRISADRQHVQFISIPRDSWVPIPGYGLNKINAAYAFGGPSLLIQTVEGVTGTRIDHFAAIDFAGFKEITDALGGVDVQVAETTSQGGVTFTAGLNHLNGEEALVYVRQRKGLPGGDLDRVQRQQNYLRAILGTVFQQNMLSDLGSTDELLIALTDSISVDENLTDTEMLSLAYSLRGLNRNSLNFLTAPVAGLGREGSQSVVYLDTARAAPMWGYLKNDTLDEHLTEFGPDLLPEVPY